MTSITKERAKKFNMLKPLETQYQGIYFRSRLEARWANYFDRREVRWIYEPNGYEIDLGYDPDYKSHDTVLWLPDFYLPDLDAHVEVKGRWAIEDNRYLESLMVAATSAGPCAGGLYLVSGLARPKDNFISSYPMLYWNDDRISLDQTTFAKEPEDRYQKNYIDNVAGAGDLRVAIDEIIRQQNTLYFSGLESDSTALGKAAGFRFDKVRF